MPGLTRLAVTIASGQSLSPAVNIGSAVLAGISMPAGWDAAVLTMQTSIDDSTWVNVASGAGTETTFQVGAGQFVQVNSALFRGMTSLKLRSGPSSGAVAQSADRVITLVLRSE